MITTDNRTDRGKLAEALELLNEAARDKRDEVKELLTDKYHHIKETMSKEGQEMLVKGQEKLYEAVRDTDLRAHKDPWPFIAGAAAVSLMVGYLMGRRK